MQVPQVPQVPKVAWVLPAPGPEMLARRLIGSRTRQGQTCTRVTPITGFDWTTIAELSVSTRDGHFGAGGGFCHGGVGISYVSCMQRESFGGRGRDSAGFCACLGDVYFRRYFYLVLTARAARPYRTSYSVQLVLMASRG
ncbi:hypothetical protein GGI35DRAFT_435048 [Trichoderma velutinum]